MRQMLEAGTFMVNENCQGFLTEAQNYYVDPQGRFSDPDDCIDSARYALLGCLNGVAEPYDGQTPQQRMAQYREQIRATAQRNQARSGWKQTFSTD